MKVKLARVGLSLVGNAIGLLIAAIVLDKMSIDGVAFVIAVVIFTVLTAVIEPLVDKVTERSAPAFQGGSALLTTLLALIVTTLVSDGLTISGLGTWIIATVLVWLLTVIAGVLLAKFLIKSAVTP
jgi:putative membrane protein